MDKKKILILYASAGSGHKKAAEAIFHALPKEGTEVQLLDIVDFMPALAKKLYRDGYLFLMARLPWLWGISYFLSDTPYLSVLNVHFRKFVNARACRRLILFLKEANPDMVISAQFLASEIVSYTKEKFGLKAKLINVVTDFGVHNFWIVQQTDIYCCASEVTKEILRSKGVPEEKIKVCGIPLDKKFTENYSKIALQSELNLKKDMFTVLIATGGIGGGPIEKIVDLLKDEAQLLVVCGTNKKLYQKLTEKNYPHVHPFGFVDYMQKLMHVSDVIVTKAGGLTVTECLAVGLPMIFFFLIPGQELNNAKVIEREGAGLIAASPQEVKDFVIQWKNVPQDREVFKSRTQSLARPNSCQDIISLI